MTRAKAQELGLRPLGVLRSYAVVGVPPEIMGIGPAFAIPEAVARAGLGLQDINVFEINEAFASQAAYCVKVPQGRWIRGVDVDALIPLVRSFGLGSGTSLSTSERFGRLSSPAHANGGGCSVAFGDNDRVVRRWDVWCVPTRMRPCRERFA